VIGIVPFCLVLPACVGFKVQNVDQIFSPNEAAKIKSREHSPVMISTNYTSSLPLQVTDEK
jgi:hypothetical protein